MPYPCGRCLPCLFNRRRLWAHRIMLEAAMYEDNAFVTLTYDTEKVDGDVFSVEPKHTQDWLKRLRFAIRPNKLRYYLVGEYGNERGRPHYHAAVFGFASCRYEKTQYRNGVVRCCVQCHLVSDTWGFGNVFLGTLEINSAQYVAGYVTKKMTRFDDPRLLSGQHPEFARMSLRPGIGGDFMHEVASTRMALNLDSTQADVPSGLRHGKRVLPLGRYLRKRLRKLEGKSEKVSQAGFDEVQAEMRVLYQAAKKASPDEVSPKKRLVKLGDQKVLQMEAKSKIFKSRGKL